MAGNEQRQINRDSLFMMAGLRVDGRDPVRRVKVRNLSSGGLMAEGDMRVVAGTAVEVELRNVGWVGRGGLGSGNRFGVAFTRISTPRAFAPRNRPLTPISSRCALWPRDAGRAGPVAQDLKLSKRLLKQHLAGVSLRGKLL
jgi:hypothetical protein